ncbi:MAG: type III-B CRISPR module-associated protein Cmr3 [Azoarcus sp.]|jgi:CRISPR-associated protein Cmr3|nr:type III-B CRISPR module-associated protein Cmr3 [Azoarcus sp.]
MSTLFLEPLDVLFLRGNKLFGDPGSMGEAQMPPPNPSVVAGALRSRILADEGVDLAAFARNEIEHPALGKRDNPGSFTLTAFYLAQRKNNVIQPLFAPPADLVLSEGNGFPVATPLKPATLAQGISTSFAFRHLPVLAQKKRTKQVSGYWLTESGWRSVLQGELPAAPEHWVKIADLWSVEDRVGIGMEAATRSAKEGQLFTTQAIAFKPGVGFVAQVTGCDAVPETGSVRLGGDGRAAALTPANIALPEPDYAILAASKRLRLILTTPGLFRQGWLPTGVADGEIPLEGVTFDLHGVRGKLIAAAVPRAETVSGWDLARWQPKAAERAAPVGSVYWLDHVEADEAALRKLAENGLWPEPCDNPQRRAEGFNRCTLAVWK